MRRDECEGGFVRGSEEWAGRLGGGGAEGMDGGDCRREAGSDDGGRREK